ncbi:hypothetical protein SLA2020_143320 [Shorea laevis]
MPSHGCPTAHMLRDVLPCVACQPTNIRGSRPCYAFMRGMKCHTAPAGPATFRGSWSADVLGARMLWRGKSPCFRPSPGHLKIRTFFPVPPLVILIDNHLRMLPENFRGLPTSIPPVLDFTRKNLLK